ncbi:hypothetical protein NVIE_015620 [Nitrososphaera viennensis EN76]|uniref:Uncharacterized protein n=1 Tax=Nitrososphaera viennensis EN76 TaxID=926571 RepID=A0A060HQI9_9ARCH|nr:hypothetical protein NVIE_015620 [Nitrososphaera viennensis EN76]
MIIRLPQGREITRNRYWTNFQLLFGHVNLGCHDGKRFCLFKCREHGVVLDYERGYEGRLECPLCSPR